MKRKNFFSLLLVSLLAVLLCVPAAATDSTTAGTSKYQAPVCVWGTLTKQADGGLLIQNDSEGAAYPEIILHGESILFLDAVTGEEISQDSISDGSTVYAYVGPAMTMSLPPQATAHLILANIPEDFGVPQYVQISSVTPQVMIAIYPTPALTWTEFTTTGGDTLKITDEATLSRFQSEDAIQLEDLVPGTRILVWSNSEGTPERVMVFDYTYRGYVTCDDADVVSVSGQRPSGRIWRCCRCGLWQRHWISPSPGWTARRWYPTGKPTCSPSPPTLREISVSWRTARCIWMQARWPGR